MVPGSIFLIEPTGDGAAPIADIVRSALPPTAWIDRPDWRGCPFLPQNGFGEIRLDVVPHAKLAAGQVLPRREQAA